MTAIHPGYGFLSENEEFCAAVEGAGIAWLGPSAKTLHDFALKHVARKIAEAAGVSDNGGGEGVDGGGTGRGGGATDRPVAGTDLPSKFAVGPGAEALLAIERQHGYSD